MLFLWQLLLIHNTSFFIHIHFSKWSCPHLSLTEETHWPITANTQLSMASYFTLNSFCVPTSGDNVHDSQHNLFIGHLFILDLLTLTAGFIYFVLKWWNTSNCDVLRLVVCYRLRPVPILRHDLIPFVRIVASVGFFCQEHTLWQYRAAYDASLEILCSLATGLQIPVLVHACKMLEQHKSHIKPW